MNAGIGGGCCCFFHCRCFIPLSAGSAITSKRPLFCLGVRSRRSRCFNRRFDYRVVDWRKRIAVVAVRASIEGWVEGTNVGAFANASGLPIGVRVEDFDVSFPETMSGVGGVLHDSRLVVTVVELSCRHMLLEALFSLAAGFSYICRLRVAWLVVSARAWCKIYYTSFVIALLLVLRLDEILT